MGEIGANGNAVTIEDTPVNGHTAEGISSNWAYDHDANAAAHHEKTGLDDSPVNGETAKGITSNWAFDHKADPIAHHAAVDPGEGHILLVPHNYDQVVQGTWVFTTDSSQLFGYYINNSPAVDGDEIDFKCFLAAGTYTLVIEGIIHTIAGIAKVYVDDVLVETWDQYNDPVTFKVINKETGIVIPTSGLKTIKWKVDGKNLSSTGYYIFLTSLCFYRTA